MPTMPGRMNRASWISSPPSPFPFRGRPAMGSDPGTWPGHLASSFPSTSSPCSGYTNRARGTLQSHDIFRPAVNGANANMAERRSSENLDSIQTKYTDTSWIARYANHRFHSTIRSMLQELEFDTLLDAGSGEGVVLAELLQAFRCQAFGLDIDLARLVEARNAQLSVPLTCGNLHALPLGQRSFDVVICLEVLEHVGDPGRALAELHRVTGKYLLVSVPNEPWWRIGNIMRGKYLRDWGNTPEHINHWTKHGFRRFLSPYFELVEVRNPVLWTFALATPLANSRA